MYKQSGTQKCSEYKSEFHLEVSLVHKYQINAALIKNNNVNVTIKKPVLLLAIPVAQKTPAIKQ
jgi:hypothetical protein